MKALRWKHYRLPEEGPPPKPRAVVTLAMTPDGVVIKNVTYNCTINLSTSGDTATIELEAP